MARRRMSRRRMRRMFKATLRPRRITRRRRGGIRL